ncbi:AMP-binding protein [Phenylobacterium sp.]|jgi:long-chain acyl-CoA synthetase|uniref:AMP-binding protein n=1 Tax=Phenylobacterium sp. TaxID=1871053 RepID=UPI002E33B453|nr:AMP-binding protein [Phenylobacterium sp.]HEX2560267.1 AMP-binding protein [Phenylobacterium sp.]
MDRAAALAEQGMVSALWAEQRPDKMALHFSGGDRTFGELHERANRLADVFRKCGLQPGDGVAIICGNGPVFVESYLAAMRSGLRLTPVNWRLAPAEAAYIVENCDARALIAKGKSKDSALACAPAPLVLRLMAGGSAEGFADYETALSAASAADPAAPEHGTLMLYTSGTTGRPKGVYKRAPEPVLPQGPGTYAAYDPEHDVALCCGPAYHAAPLLMDVRWPLASGVPVVMMEKFDPEDALRLIAQHRVTHTHMVPTMFQRLLQLPQAVRDRYDVSSLKMVIHGAAPCPVETKRAMIEWLGPVLTEYYAATEGSGGFVITSDEWLRKPGSVGRLDPSFGARVLDESGTPCPPGAVGKVYLRAEPGARFSYYKDPQKTDGLFEGDHFTLGDMGYLDEDGYLFLTGRTAELIISGGVNIYPQEIDNVVGLHPAVADVCTIGAPNDEWGEEVRSVVELRAGVSPSPELAEEILAFVRERLSGYKRPRAIDFAAELPRLASGKIQRAAVRAPYWQGRRISI